MAQNPQLTYNRYKRVQKQFNELMNVKEFDVRKYNYEYIIRKVGHDNDYRPNTVTQIINKTDEEMELLLNPKQDIDPKQKPLF